AQAPPAPPAAQAAARATPQTVANLTAQIVKKLEAKTTRFDVQLDPDGLGKVDVRVEIGAGGRITAALSCHNPQAQAELKARSGELQQALEQAGFDLSGGGLSFEMAGGQGGNTGPGQGQNDTGQAFRGRAFQTALDTAGDAAQSAADGALRLNSSRFAGVDIRI
ncbi:MAG: flagellar hook length determination-like protein, partial [Phenylobacterium sp.]|nr:flagellar hook length determination-like protein [Phenylobacterium sp.]